MKKYAHPEQTQSGFTLVEMAMVLFIVTLLLTGLVPTITSQMEQQRTNETRKQMAEIRDALIGYALIYGRLPCSADPTKITGQSGFGTERTSCSAGTAWGVVPWATLGTSETDAWGNHFTYNVTHTFADATNGTGVGTCATTAGISFQLCSDGSLTVKSAASGANVASNIPAIIISHGKNGAGAWSQKGTQLPASSNADEAENSNSNTVYVSRIPSTDYDDLVVWITPNILYNRMVTAGKLP
jgi:prepilin-type N-terminal cleavage/methylation domain-containing protein